MNHLTRITGITLLGLILLAAGPVMAQPQSNQTNQASSAESSAQNFSHQQLRSFADASAKIRDIQQSAIQKMQQAKDKKARMEISKQARKDMIQAVKDAGLTVKEYNEIARAARSNPQLSKKIRQLQ